jgi:predicted dehydrogenase
MMQDPLNVTVVGALGRMGKRRVEAVRSLPQLRLVRLVDIDPMRLKEEANRLDCHYATDWEWAVAQDDTDLVIICTPNFLHAAIAIAALESGKHVLVEKPLCTSVSDAVRMVTAAANAGRILKTGFNCVFRPPVRKALDIIQAGAIGDVLGARGCTGHSQFVGCDPPPWFLQRDLAGGGVVLDLGVHLFDLARRVVGPMSAVSARMTVDPIVPTELETTAAAVFTTSAGKVFSIHASWVDCRPFLGLRLEVFGTDGRVEIDLATNTTRLVTKRDGRVEVQDFGFPRPAVCPSWSAELAHLCDAIALGVDPDGNGADGLPVMAMAESVYESARCDGKPVPISAPAHWDEKLKPRSAPCKQATLELAVTTSV